ncbi:PITH domain-containing protein [Pyronema domesticum]|uniref:Similar to Thioredoxin-like protein 1 acc. no. Q9USR1 n=1 Tax=Pyronema omphalodes (strain CBS 100304) TaxID=1076935 RepID=U4L568_PYROM|nr:PITH domain-containing protein [Pyronema domesticum]CCX12197.1 Similar to Thioredoxin-like protein 1; acc. no. Q9USR1 [Pyronema omphalodes CBS 100304]
MPSYSKITSSEQLVTFLASPKVSIVAFYKSDHEVLNTIGGVAARLTDQIALAHCDVKSNAWAESQFQITTDPTFLVFKNAQTVMRLPGVQALASSLSQIRSLVEGDKNAGEGSAATPTDSSWVGASPSGKYVNITSSVNRLALEMLNSDHALGSASTLFEGTKPTALSKESATKDWVESLDDPELMLLVSFQNAVKLYSIQITSLPDENSTRPTNVKIYQNTTNIVSFDELDGRQATENITIKPEDWNENGTATVLTTFRKFQECSSFTIFFGEPEDEDCERIRIDRIRVFGVVKDQKFDGTKLKQQPEE